jgi:transcriptional regulator with XRE-family HTH domain
VVIRWEAGRNRPRAETLDRIAKVGGVSVEWLLGGSRRQRARVGEDQEWEAAVKAFGELWEEPGRRPTVLRLLRELASLASGRSGRAGHAVTVASLLEESG